MQFNADSGWKCWIAGILMAVTAAPALAITTIEDFERRRDAIRSESRNYEATQAANAADKREHRHEEIRFIDQAWAQWIGKQPADDEFGFNMGHGSFNGSSVVAATDQDTRGTLAYRVVNSRTGARAAFGGVQSVDYYVNGDPDNPGDYEYLGTSNDVLNDFAMPYYPEGNSNHFEPVVKSIPRDGGGNEVFMGGWNAEGIGRGHVTIMTMPFPSPEPGSLALLALGMLSSLGRRMALRQS